MLNEYILIFFTLLILQLLYFRVAKYFKIIDVPNHRSSHQNITIRGAGIIFPAAALLYLLFSDIDYPFFYIGLIIIGIISFIDDIVSLPNKYRIIVHIVCTLLLLYQIQEIKSYSYLFLFILLIWGIALLNAYNFMDGINGINGANSLAMLLSFMYINIYIYSFIDNLFLITIIISVLVFLFFNFRKKAICFAGDIGSISIAFILLFLNLKLIFITQEWKFVLFFFCYGADTFYTIIYRLQMKQNIFVAHRIHFFQLLVHEYNCSHLQVATLYAVIQLCLNIWIVNQSVYSFIFYVPLLVLIISIHLLRIKRGFGITIK